MTISSSYEGLGDIFLEGRTLEQVLKGEGEFGRRGSLKFWVSKAASREGMIFKSDRDLVSSTL